MKEQLGRRPRDVSDLTPFNEATCVVALRFLVRPDKSGNLWQFLQVAHDLHRSLVVVRRKWKCFGKSLSGDLDLTILQTAKGRDHSMYIGKKHRLPGDNASHAFREQLVRRVRSTGTPMIHTTTTSTNIYTEPQ